MMMKMIVVSRVELGRHHLKSRCQGKSHKYKKRVVRRQQQSEVRGEVRSELGRSRLEQMSYAKKYQASEAGLYVTRACDE